MANGTAKVKLHYDMQFELIVIGDSGVGKTCILLRYADDMFKMTFMSTVGMEFKVKTIEVDGKIIKLQIWDTAGQERFRTITTSYYRAAMGIMLVFDVTDQKSFDNVSKWVKNIEKHASTDVEVILVGNKCDLESRRVIPHNRGQQMAESQNVSYIETSAKTNHNIDKAFETLARQIIKKRGNKMTRRQEDLVDLKQKENSNKCSC